VSTAAIVLAGGRSRRMGVPKDAVALGGRTLLDRVLDAVVPLPTVVVGPPTLAGAVSLRPAASLTRERPAFSGPVAAIAAAIDELDRREETAETALILSCDLARPADAVALLQRSAAALADGLALNDAGDRLQWLCGLYRLGPVRASIARLRSTASLDAARVSTLFSGLAVTPLADPDGLSFDIDTPADLAAAIGKATG
jgi:molybdopterin-guanine dinucleotide biosynthesis protein A